MSECRCIRSSFSTVTQAALEASVVIRLSIALFAGLLAAGLPVIRWR